jgi:mannosyltransferase
MPHTENLTKSVTPTAPPRRAVHDTGKTNLPDVTDVTRSLNLRPHEATNSREKLHVLITLGICLVGVLAIAKFVLLKQSIRLDEAQTLWQCSHSIPGLLKVVAQDVHVPLYHLIVHFWLMYVGHSVIAVRLLSLIFFLATIPFVYLFGRQIMSYKWALIATAIFSFLPFMNWYANEARMYTMLALIAAANQYYFVRLMRRRTGWIGFTVTAMAGVYTHYFFIFTLAAEGIFFLVQRRQFAAKSLRKMIALAVLLGAILAPWLYYFVSLGAASNTRPMVPKPSAVDFFNAYSQFLFGFQTNRINTILVSSWPLLVVFGFFAIRRSTGANKIVQFLITIAVLPPILAYVLSLITQPFFLSRYMIASVPALVLALVWFISRYPRRYALAMVSVVIAAIGATSYLQATSIDNPMLENYKNAADYVNSHATTRDVIVLSAPFTVYPFQYYYNGSTQLNTLPQWNRQVAGAIPTFNAQKLPSEVNAIKRNHTYIYVLLSYNQGYEKTVKLYLDTLLERVSSKHFSPDMNLYVYKVNYNPIPAL